MRTVLGLVLIVSACVVMTTAQEQGNADAAKVKNPVATSPESLAAGEAIYRRRCSGCHARDGSGGPPKEAGEVPPSNLADATWDHGSTDGEMSYVIRNGIGPKFIMEPWDDRLSETDTWNVVNYIRSLKK